MLSIQECLQKTMGRKKDTLELGGAKWIIKKSYLIFNTCLYTGLALCLISLMIKITWLGILGIVIFILGILQTSIFYRCPNCHKALNFREKKLSTVQSADTN